MKNRFSYANAGVDIDVADKAKKGIKPLVKSTFTKGVLSEIGKFGGFFAPDFSKYKNPVLVSSVDGVGTKLKIAVEMNRYDTVGIDIVNHCVDDILVHGAKALYFMDYIAMAKTVPEKIYQIVKGMASACKAEGCALIGGETAQMPDVYAGNDFDIAGMIVGVVEKDKIIDGKEIANGDAIIGLPSSGLHTNGYTLARKLFESKKDYGFKKYIPELKKSAGEALLIPHRSYSKPVFEIIERFHIKGMAHITGGGFIDNVPRVLPKNVSAVIKKHSFEVLPIFKVMREIGKLDDREMYRTFNMGIGMAIIMAEKEAAGCIEFLTNMGEKPKLIGEIIRSTDEEDRVILS
jgi:phosphoribosylformylglycinamidine cyclo-ligase